MPTSDDDNYRGNGKARRDELEPEGSSEADKVEMFESESEECPPELSAQFWLSVAAYEQAPSTTHFQLLEEAGIELSAPESLDDQRLTAKLWEVIEALARLRVFLSQTDHLSDRELYTLLWRELLREPVKDMPLDNFSTWHTDLLGSGSEEDIYLYLKYYADDATRHQWSTDFPDDKMPDQEEPLFNRDHHLPQANDSTQTNVEDGEVM
jgi:hypothetical protein